MTQHAKTKKVQRFQSKGLSRRALLGQASAVGLGALIGSALPFRAAFAQTPVKGGVLKMGLGGGESTDSLDPALALAQVAFNTIRTFGETLVEVDGDGALEMRLASDVRSSPDVKTWTFTIREGVKFHDGTPMTANDVLETLRRHSDEESQSGALGIMKGIADMSVNGSELVLELTEANADLPYLLSDYHLIIQPNGGRDNPAAGIGTGPYRIVEFEPGVRCVMEKFADYWDDSRGHFDGVEIAVINDPTARNAALQSGQVHVINGVAPKVAGLLARAPNIEVKNTSGRGHYVFIMHCNTPPFDNVDLRMALKLAINRQEMVDKILQGYGSVGNDIPINASYPLFDDTRPQREYDPEMARAFYEKSGHDGSPIVLRVADVAFAGAVDAAQLFQESARAAGIPLEISREPGDGYWSDVWNVQPFCASYWGGRPVQDQMYSTAYLSTADWNDTRFFDPEFDAMLLEARGELDLEKRKVIYRKMADKVADEGGLICPMFNDFIEAINTDVQGWETIPTAEMMNGLVPSKCWFA